MTDLFTDFVRFIAQALVAGLWQGVALIFAVALILGLLPRLKAALRFFVWALTFAAVAILPLIKIRPYAERAAASPGSIHLAIGWAVAITGLWAAAVLVRAAQLFYQAYRLRGIWKNATPVAAAGSNLLLLEEAGRTLPRCPQLCTSLDVDAPCVIGFLSPRLLVPEWLFTELTETDLRHIILHECEHLRRRDDWINLLQKLTLVLFPLSPALFFADRRLVLERELACDAGVIAATAAPFDYATCLTHLAERRASYRRSSLALALSAWNRRQSELVRRVGRLLKPAGTMSVLQARGALFLLLFALAAGSFGLSRAPQPISFGLPAPSSLADNEPTSRRVGSVLPRERVTAVPVVFDLTAPAFAEPSNPRRKNPKASQGTKNARAAVSTHALGTTIRPQPRVLFTDTRDYEQQSRLGGSHVLLTGFSPAYAAVPFADGWLIIQL